MLAGLLVAATLAIAPGVALARGGGGGGGGSHGGGGWLSRGAVALRGAAFTTVALRTTVLYRTDHSILGVGFVHDHDRFIGHHFVFGNPGPGITTRTIPGLRLRLFLRQLFRSRSQRRDSRGPAGASLDWATIMAQSTV